MANFVIITDDFCDLTKEYAKKHEVTLLPTSFELDEEIFSNDEKAENHLSVTDFYAGLRAGKMPKTSALSMPTIKDAMEEAIKAGNAVLYLAFSSGLSASYNNARLASEELKEEYPYCQIRVVDSLCASLGMGLFVHRGITYRDNGDTLAQAADRLESEKLKLCHYFTVDDLNFLHRGGRVSKTSAVVGSLLGIKPILHVDDEGHLIAIGKVRGRKASLDQLVSKMEQRVVKSDNDVIFISHGDCLEEAEYVATQVRKKTGFKSIVINHVGPTIGAHSGPGTMALFFMADSRAE